MLAVDASTLILLAKTELLDLFLEEFNGKPAISTGVEIESTKKGTFDAILIKERIQQQKIIVKAVKNKDFVEKISKDFRLHLGEAETIALCIENQFKAVATDDYNAIKACSILQINYISALGILLRLNEQKKLDKKEAMLKLNALKYFGRYSDEIINECKNAVR